MLKFLFGLLFSILFSTISIAQLYSKHALRVNRGNLYRNLVKNSINKTIDLPINDSSLQNWESAFNAMALLNYKNLYADSKIVEIVKHIETYPESFNENLVTFIFAKHPFRFFDDVYKYLPQVSDPYLFSICVNYLLQADSNKILSTFLKTSVSEKLKDYPTNDMLRLLKTQIDCTKYSKNLKALFAKNYLRKQVLVFSFQRRNRNYPGLVIVRDTSGNILMNSESEIFSIPQLARSISNLPFYFFNANTPQGIFRMDNFSVSSSSFIGPTPNLQLFMPFERTASKFYQNHYMVDSVWGIVDYRNLLPYALQKDSNLYQSFYAGKLGRSEIISHGTVVNPAYYQAASYFPFTPTAGCLATKEIWNEETGMLAQSDQLKLNEAVNQAGGPHGYFFVIEIDDSEKPVSIEDVLAAIK